MAIISFGFPYSFTGNVVWKVLFGVFPWSSLCQGYELLSEGISDNTMKLVLLNGILTIQAYVYTMLAFYFHACLPDNDGTVKLPWYLFDFSRLYPKVCRTVYV